MSQSDAQPGDVFPPNSEASATSDAVLWSRVQSGDAAAFESLFRAHHPGMCAFARRMVGSADVAEDLAQEVFLYIWRHRESVQMRASARVYLYSALRHGALRYFRHERVVQRHVPETISLFDRAPRQADANLLSVETLALIRTAIGRLPERCRLVYTLHREQGLTYAEIAEVMQTSPKTVDVQMGRALKALRRALGNHR